MKTPPIRSNSNPVAASKRTAFTVILAIALFLWMISPFSASPRQLDRVPFSQNSVEDHFSHFEGHGDCGIRSTQLYVPPVAPDDDAPKHTLYCNNRATLLEAMSGGGRHGFEKPYFPAGCHYRWYSTAEICMILERFDAIVFIGDDSLKHIYAAFNMLLRENMAMGSLKQWELNESQRDACRCDNQFTKSECWSHMIMESQSVKEKEDGVGHRNPFFCDRTPHVFLPVTDSPAPEELHASFTSLISGDPDAYKPIPVIHSLSLATSLSWSKAVDSMDEWVTLADASGRNIPILWVGPNTAGHLKPPGQILTQGNNALWHYTLETMKEAKARQLDALGMYNLTLQANSWDGSNYGQRVGLVQAMMVINWLSRVEST
ncbi:hypothetical protein HO133_002284 [Letharia lupina]|uniref:Uncharacterized protein n=1 Tax=Letharia lupina TaxID=560253 RepID=A0A8H6CDA2_9LECA|nr:uncharacterized protein HO133_002284 [Letharia lupina]KAF6221428.1 hypothetical protein HO133_002284 [Letharia lupina]